MVLDWLFWLFGSRNLYGMELALVLNAAVLHVTCLSGVCRVVIIMNDGEIRDAHALIFAVVLSRWFACLCYSRSSCYVVVQFILLSKFFICGLLEWRVIEVFHVRSFDLQWELWCNCARLCCKSDGVFLLPLPCFLSASSLWQSCHVICARYFFTSFGMELK